jgi:hypothetical protein
VCQNAVFREYPVAAYDGSVYAGLSKNVKWYIEVIHFAEAEDDRNYRPVVKMKLVVPTGHVGDM